jgi:biotin carboxylase
MLLRKRKSSQLAYFVSIGSGLNQIPLINEAKKLGFHVIGVDASTSAAGFFLCDLKIQESIENHDAIYKKLLELLVDGDIHGIMTKSYGTAIVTASYLNEIFKIPFLPSATSGDFIDKRKMKSTFINNNILTPYIIPVSHRMKIEKIPASSFPVIVKPVVGHAKIDVRMAANVSDLKKHGITNDMFTDSYTMEKFVEGNEIIAAGIIHDKRYYLVEMTDKKTLPPPSFIDIMHIAPSRYLHLWKNIEVIGQAVSDAFSITASPLIMEFVINKDEEPFLIEAVPEFGGEFLPDVLVPASAGYNIIAESIKSMTKRGFKPPQPRKNRNSVVVRYITGRKGILASCNPEGPSNIKGTIFSRIFKEIGSPISEPVTNHDRIGVVVVTAETPGEAITLAEHAASNFNIRIK